MQKNWLVSILVLFFWVSWAAADVFVVTTTQAVGTGSLHQAFVDANAHSGPDEIVFQIPETDSGYDENGGIWTIRVTSLFEIIDDGLTIDGRSQAEYIGRDTNPNGPEILLVGSDLLDTVGLRIIGENNTIRDLAFYDFRYAQIICSSDYNRFYGCHVGFHPVTGEPSPKRTTGLEFSDAHYNTIGGLSEGEANIISGNKNSAIYFSNCHYNQVQGNLIGLLPAGQDSLGNGDGVVMYGSVGNVIGPENVIAASKVNGISCLQACDSTTIIGNIIGTDISQEKLYSSGSDGIQGRESSHIDIGGLGPDEGNVICNSGFAGICFNDCSSSRIRGNFIGTNKSTEIALPNKNGISLIHSTQVDIGGDQPGAGNVISGNLESGVYIQSAGSQNNRVIANHIGIGLDETHVLPNGEHGIYIHNQAANNRVGPDNVIAYNQMHGIYISRLNMIGNTITQNSIFRNGEKGIEYGYSDDMLANVPLLTGSDPVSGIALPNSHIEIYSGPDDEGKIFHAAVNADAQGRFTWPGTPEGVMITATATDDQGTTSEFSRAFSLQNLVVTHGGDQGIGSLRHALQKANEQAGPDTILFNIPQSDAGYNGSFWMIQPQSTLPSLEDSGTVIIGQSQSDFSGNSNPHGPEILIKGNSAPGKINFGLEILSPYNVISGLVISGFNKNGIQLIGPKAKHNRLVGNYIGTTADGSDALCNNSGIYLQACSHNIIGGTTETDRNIVSGNCNSGILVYKSEDNIILGNYIGTDKSGTKALSNQTGIIVNKSIGNVIGGDVPEAANLISGNSSAGIALLADGTAYNRIEGNIIGADVTGTTGLGNGSYGISITNGVLRCTIVNNVISNNTRCGIYVSRGNHHTIRMNRIGTDKSGMKRLGNLMHGIKIWEGAHNQIGNGNIISGNHRSGVVISTGDSNVVHGNLIGLNAAASDSLPNRHYGVRLEFGTRYTLIGGENLDNRNIISGNGYSGLITDHDSTQHNRIINNYIGTDNSGSKAIGNLSFGIQISATQNRIEKNLISGNRNDGITLFKGSMQNKIMNNHIGVKADGVSPLGNGENGVLVRETMNDTIGPGNVIWHNQRYGVFIDRNDAFGVTITQNSITMNGERAIQLYQTANNNIETPVLTQSPPLTGTAPANSTVEIFSDSLGEALVYEGSVKADAGGNWSYDGPLTWSRASATATDLSGNTSELSAALKVSVRQDQIAVLPDRYFLRQNFPNPFNPQTQIQFGIARSGKIRLDLYDVLGRHVTTLVESDYRAGNYSITLDAGGLPSGVYFYRLEAGRFKALKKMILLE